MKSLTSFRKSSVKPQRPKQSTFIVGLLTTLLLTLSLFAKSSPNSIRQTITLTIKDAPLVNIFSEIRKQSGYDFLFKSSWLNKTKPVSLNVKHASIKDVLDIIFKDQPLSYQIMDKTVILKSTIDTSEKNNILEKPIDVKGQVFNEKGEPVNGVTVTIKGSSIATSTNVYGEFSLSSVDQDAILVFTSVNMETFELKVNGKADLSIQLKTKITALGDVVITVSTGYQDIPKERATGSFVKIDNATLNQQVGTNILKRLEGVASGILFDNNKTINGVPKNDNITIRGLSTINASLDPLIVLDGFIYEGGINNINPNDVENVTILKDAAASSIWGARAGNGVIIITTKKGQFNQKLQVNSNATLTISEKPGLFYLPQMSSNDYINVEQFLFTQGFFNSRINTKYQSLTPAVEIFLKKRNGQITAADSAALINSLKAIDSRDQYNKYAYRNSVTQQYSVNLRGGSNNNAYTISLAYDKLLGELKNKFQKVNIKINNTYRPVKDLSLNLGVYYTQSESESGLSGYNGLQVGSRQIPYLRLADENGTPLSVATLYRDAYIDTAGSGKLLDWRFYPLKDYKHSKNSVDLQELFANIGIQYKLSKFLNADIKYQYQKQQSISEQLSDLESFNARNLINSFSQLDRSSGVINYIIPKGGIRNLQNSYVSSYTARAQLNFNHSWKEHSVAAIIGAETRESKSSGNQFTAYGYNEDPLTSSNVDYRNTYRTFITGSFQSIPGSPSFGESVYRFASFYANASYTYKNRYILSASGRRDGSNLFGAKTNDRWNPLWSIGASWKLSDETFYTSAIIPSLRLRGSYGYSGNIDLSRSAIPVGMFFTSSITNLPYTTIQNLSNPNLRWEKSGMLNIGLDFALKNEIISGSIEYYQKKGTDLYGPSLYDYTVWGSSNQITINASNMRGHGVDVMLNSKNINKTFKWSSSLLFNYNTNKVTQYYGNIAKSITSKFGSGTSIIPVVGKPLYGISAYKWGGLDTNGNPQGYVNGVLSTDYRAIGTEADTKGVEGNIVYVGPSSPPVFGSLINTFSWNNISLSVNVGYKFGYYFKKSILSYTQLINSGIGHKDYAKRWQKSGDELITNVPSFLYPSNSNNQRRDNFYSNAEINILKADHIRLQYINLSYSIISSTNNSMPFKDIQVYINASNLGILWKANNEGLDPEYPSTLPPSKTFAFGFRANF